MSNRVLVVDLAISTQPTPLLLPRILIPIGKGRATVSLDGATVEQVVAELLAAGLQVSRCKVVEQS